MHRGLTLQVTAMERYLTQRVDFVSDRYGEIPYTEG